MSLRALRLLPRARSVLMVPLRPRLPGPWISRRSLSAEAEPSYLDGVAYDRFLKRIRRERNLKVGAVATVVAFGALAYRHHSHEKQERRENDFETKVAKKVVDWANRPLDSLPDASVATLIIPVETESKVDFNKTFCGVDPSSQGFAQELERRRKLYVQEVAMGLCRDDAKTGPGVNVFDMARFMGFVDVPLPTVLTQRIDALPQREQVLTLLDWQYQYGRLFHLKNTLNELHRSSVPLTGAEIKSLRGNILQDYLVYQGLLVRVQELIDQDPTLGSWFPTDMSTTMTDSHEVSIMIPASSATRRIETLRADPLEYFTAKFDALEERRVSPAPVTGPKN